MIKKMIIDCLTEPDGITFCSVRIAFVFGIFSFVGLYIGSLVMGHAFNGIEFGTGFSSLLVTGGAGMGFKSKLGSDSIQPEPEKIKGE